MTVADLICELSKAHDMNADIECRIGYTFYEKDKKTRRELERALTPSGGITHDRNGRVILTLYQLEHGISQPLKVSR